jgi:polysaccharide export outer membrane protein
MFRRLLLCGAIAVCLVSLLLAPFSLAAQVKTESATPAAPPAAAPGTPGAPPAATPAKAADDELRKQAGEPVDPNTYIIGSEDILRVTVWDQPNLSGPVTVRPDGMITLPLVKNDLKAGGITPRQLTDLVTKAYEEFIIKPEVMVRVEAVNSKFYYISGEVGRPGQYPLVTAKTVMQALTIAGGLREFAKKKDIVITRGPKRFKFNYSDVIKGKNMQQNIYLESGDMINVP